MMMTEWNTRFGRDVLTFWVLLKAVSSFSYSQTNESISATSRLTLYNVLRYGPDCLINSLTLFYIYSS